MARPMIDFAWLKNLQARKGRQLTTCETPAGTVHVDGQPDAFVAALIRLAEIGQKLEVATAAAATAPGAKVPTPKSSVPLMRSQAPPSPQDEETLTRAHAAWIMALGQMPDSVEVVMTNEQARAALKMAIEATYRVSVDDIARLVDPAAYCADVAMDDATRSWSLEEAREKALRIQRLFFGSIQHGA
ncbi:hypothetical protein GCM10017620_26290 [Brevundimonas intermedia]|uniref:Uncharacterized protein n=1 Tax=Brevundimonas intermedia TaxID=74315 RepID=A0ABQ5TAL5_9CAUL|nr:hypothetical protein [Brevundimonas intermedia]GLK49656.1 hypothetical protein GCM10017620_26290 [Brevundimonas intermedia]